MTKTKELDAISVPLLAEAVEPLLSWYREDGRSLPWREEPTPYHVWLSEIMLQQTRIAAVIPYYHRFLEALPSVRALSEVEDGALMKLWEGLGYYSRARNLKAAARRIVEEHGGDLPRDYKSLLSLPGIGEYTAGAVSSIAFGLPEPAVDGNVLRVVARLCNCRADITRPDTKRRVTDALRAVYPSGHEAGRLTEALMELGERVCIPNGTPHCGECPWAPLCQALVAGSTEELPVRSAKKPRRIEHKTVFLLEYEGRYALSLRPDNGLLAGLWEFPSRPDAASPEEAADTLRKWGITPSSLAPCGEAKHVFTHVEWHMTGYRVTCATPPEGFTLATPEDLSARYALPRAFSFFSALLFE